MEEAKRVSRVSTLNRSVVFIVQSAACLDDVDAKRRSQKQTASKAINAAVLVPIGRRSEVGLCNATIERAFQLRVFDGWVR